MRPVFAPRRWSAASRSELRRAGLADGLERAVAAAGTARDPWTLAAPREREEIRVARELVLELASRLREPRTVPRRVLRAVDRLLTDPCSPLYSPAPPGSLHDALLDAILALDDARPGAR